MLLPISFVIFALAPADAEKPALAWPAHERWVSSVAFRPDGKRIATGSSDDKVKVWNAETGKEFLAHPISAYLAR